jgi:alpha-1,3/alpha-1,6-mannosyltransferase
LLSLNRFEKKKNAALAISSFALLKTKLVHSKELKNMRLMIAGETNSNFDTGNFKSAGIGGYDPRLEDNMMTLVSLIDRAKACSLTYNIITPSTSKTKIAPFNCTRTNPDVTFLLNFTTGQRSTLLRSALALLYTPSNEHFGIGPVEGMLCGLPVLACNSGGPTESVLVEPTEDRTGWLCPPDPQAWANALLEIVSLTAPEREALSERSRTRARALFTMDAMAGGLEAALQEAAAKGPVRTSAFWNLLLPIVFLFIVYVVGTRTFVPFR